MRHAIAPLLLLLLGSCKAFGGGNDDAVAVNTVVRSYNKTAEDTWRAVHSSLKEMDLTIDKDTHDALGGTIEARRGNKDEIHIEARSQDRENTRLSIWVDPGDRSMAQILQDRVADKLGMNVARPSQSAGSQVEGTYDKKLDQCVAAAEAVIRDMRLSSPRKEMHDTWARVDSTHLDSIPVQFRMERTHKDETLVVFSAGTAATDDNTTLATKLKTEFERRLTPEDQPKHPEAKP